MVTGAGSGLGRQISLRLSEEGATVLLADVDVEAMRCSASELPGLSECHVLDVTNESDWATAERRVLEKFGRLDVLVNAAGIAMAKDNLSTCTRETFQQVLNVNVTGTFLGCQLAQRVMTVKGGSVINIGSIRSLVASSDTLAYSTSKTALLGLTRAAALYTAERGLNVRFNLVCPGAINTTMQQEWVASASDPQLAAQQMMATYPMGRIGKADEVAALVLFLAGDESQYVTGTHLSVDGGFTA